eukprot:scaffold423_cov69-Phaeocystis_antarctica.AAC.9
MYGTGTATCFPSCGTRNVIVVQFTLSPPVWPAPVLLTSRSFVITPMGCWRLPQGGGRIFSTLHAHC